MSCSFHPHHIKSSIVFSQLLRLKRICSDISDYEHEVIVLTQSLLSRCYPYKLISEQINHVSHIVRTKSMTRISNQITNEKRITFITHFHPSIATFLKNANKDWLDIRTDNRFDNKLSNPIILANKQLRNLLLFQIVCLLIGTAFFRCVSIFDIFPLGIDYIGMTAFSLL